MSKRQIHAELLLGRRIRALNGRVIGRLEDIYVRQAGRACFVEEYLTGRYALLERLAGLSIVRAMLKVFGAHDKESSYRIPWDKLDLTDPRRPRLLCEVSELRKVDPNE